MNVIRLLHKSRVLNLRVAPAAPAVPAVGRQCVSLAV